MYWYLLAKSLPLQLGRPGLPCHDLPPWQVQKQYARLWPVCRFSSHVPHPSSGLYGSELPQGGPPELHGRPITDSPLNSGGDFATGRGAVPLGTMLPPPNLVVSWIQISNA